VIENVRKNQAALAFPASLLDNFAPESGRNSVVECQLPKLDVAGSTPVARSKIPPLLNHVLATIFRFAAPCACEQIVEHVLFHGRVAAHGLRARAEVRNAI
jgi:hypothetical protein